MKPTERDRTIEFYDRNAAKYFDETANLDVESLRRKFTELVPRGGRILDAGCGSGRDSKSFLTMGFEVVAIDASKGMAEQARERFGINARVLRMEDIPFENEFDGVWASASLLHLPESLLKRVISQLTDALRVGGIFYGSFKYGKKEKWREERFFCDMDEGKLLDLIEGVDSLALLEIWETENYRHGPPGPIVWENFLAKKVKALEL